MRRGFTLHDDGGRIGFPVLDGTVAEIGCAVARMVELVGAVLDAAESRRHGALPVARAAADLGEIARAVVAELLAAHPARDIALDVEGDARGRPSRRSSSRRSSSRSAADPPSGTPRAAWGSASSSSARS